MESSRKNVSNKESIEPFLNFVYETVENLKPDPHLLINIDETPLNPPDIDEMVAVPSDCTVIPTTEKEIRITNTNLTLAISISGDSYPSQLIVKGHRVPSELLTVPCPELYIQTTQRGYQTRESFQCYLENCLFPIFFSIREAFPPSRQNIVLLLDLHSSRLDPKWLEKCRERNIHIIAFPPHSSHILQPLDRGVNAILKRKLGNYLKEQFVIPFSFINNLNVLRNHSSKKSLLFPAVTSKKNTGRFRLRVVDAVKKSLSDTLTTSIIQFSFKRAGLFDADSMDLLLSKLPSVQEEEQSESTQSSEMPCLSESSSNKQKIQFPYSTYLITSPAVISELPSTSTDTNKSSHDNDVVDKEENEHSDEASNHPQTSDDSNDLLFSTRGRKINRRNSYSPIPFGRSRKRPKLEDRDPVSVESDSNDL